MSGDPTGGDPAKTRGDQADAEPAASSSDAEPVERDDDADPASLDDEDPEASGDAAVEAEPEPEAAWSVVVADWEGGAATEDALEIGTPPPPPRRPAMPGERVRYVVLAQIGLALVGAIPWWALLWSTRDLSVLEAAWFFAAALGVGLAWQGHARMLRWQVAFGCVTAAVPLLLQMRGADLLLGFGLATFYGALAGFLLVAVVLGGLTLREIVAVL